MSTVKRSPGRTSSGTSTVSSRPSGVQIVIGSPATPTVARRIETNSTSPHGARERTCVEIGVEQRVDGGPRPAKRAH
eukprot:5274282-Prymnesium_polylepis.1